MKIVAISDTHEQEDKIILPEGDILIHSGDITYNGSISAITKFADWLEKQPFKHKVVILGNHDLFEHKNQDIPRQVFNREGIHFLHNSGVEIDGLFLYGSPNTPYFHGWAWNSYRGPDIAKIWAQIPERTNILVSHGPIMGILDKTPGNELYPGENVGCNDLLIRSKQLKNLKAHFCGHIHYSYGQTEIDNIKFVNGSSCNEQYQPVNLPIIVEI